MNHTSYQQPGQIGQSAMGQPARGRQIWDLASQTNAFGNVAYTAQLGLSSQVPQHAAQQMTQYHLRLPESTPQSSIQRPFEGQYEYPQLHQSLPIFSPFHIRPHDTGSAIDDWDLRHPATPSITMSSGTSASARETGIPESSRSSQAAPSHSLGQPRPILPLPSRASHQNFEPIAHRPVHSLDPPPTPDSMTDDDLLDMLEQSSQRVDGMLVGIQDRTAGTSSTAPSGYSTPPSSSDVLSFFAGTSPPVPASSLDHMPRPHSWWHDEYGKDVYETLFGVGFSTFLDDSHSGQSSTTQQLEYDPDDVPAPWSPAPAPKRKTTAPYTQGREKRARKDDPQKPMGWEDSTRSTASQVQRNTNIISEASTSQGVPTSDETFLSYTGVNTGTAMPAEEETREEGEEEGERVGPKYKPHLCRIEGCKWKESFNRKRDYYRHICTKPEHEAERSLPGWRQRHGIPEDFKDILVFCPVENCTQRYHGMRKDTMKTHLWKQHRIGEPPKKRPKKC
ncbi:uncharacterized protein STEHIDRAFT_159168 [Stereum hirsutum FP-91666 SS1]|uniref:uncharacterized protein n=1 Tax=Stereum hirsutum (strain FP-91666) TaxID=721885 RepID=UPI0004449D01|nr:uncharacterized protein STEHIDRAFT_159168 [Stereum hirsutum FP-91666 SS1]EIM84497.1 hypothetical protein STEHIDRAFT_159168 [Stereum hirsutum FP-91666 SS1]